MQRRGDTRSQIVQLYESNSQLRPLSSTHAASLSRWNPRHRSFVFLSATLIPSAFFKISRASRKIESRHTRKSRLCAFSSRVSRWMGILLNTLMRNTRIAYAACNVHVKRSSRQHARYSRLSDRRKFSPERSAVLFRRGETNQSHFGHRHRTAPKRRNRINGKSREWEGKSDTAVQHYVDCSWIVTRELCVHARVAESGWSPVRPVGPSLHSLMPLCTRASSYSPHTLNGHSCLRASSFIPNAGRRESPCGFGGCRTDERKLASLQSCDCVTHAVSTPLLLVPGGRGFAKFHRAVATLPAFSLDCVPFGWDIVRADIVGRGSTGHEENYLGGSTRVPHAIGFCCEVGEVLFSW